MPIASDQKDAIYHLIHKSGTGTIPQAVQHPICGQLTSNCPNGPICYSQDSDICRTSHAPNEIPQLNPQLNINVLHDSTNVREFVTPVLNLSPGLNTSTMEIHQRNSPTGYDLRPRSNDNSNLHANQLNPANIGNATNFFNWHTEQTTCSKSDRPSRKRRISLNQFVEVPASLNHNRSCLWDASSNISKRRRTPLRSGVNNGNNRSSPVRRTRFRNSSNANGPQSFLPTVPQQNPNFHNPRSGMLCDPIQNHLPWRRDSSLLGRPVPFFIPVPIGLAFANQQVPNITQNPRAYPPSQYFANQYGSFPPYFFRIPTIMHPTPQDPRLPNDPSHYEVGSVHDGNENPMPCNMPQTSSEGLPPSSIYIDMDSIWSRNAELNAVGNRDAILHHHLLSGEYGVHPYDLMPQSPEFPSRDYSLFYRLIANEARIQNGDNQIQDYQGLIDNGQNGENYEALLDLAARIGDEKVKGMSRAKIEQLSSYRISNIAQLGTENSCPVCMSNFEMKQMIRALPCCHKYHAKCIDKWLKENSTCPICRRDAADFLQKSSA